MIRSLAIRHDRDSACRVPGFSLIELLVVLAVVAILAAILLPVVGKVRQQANITTDSSNLRQIQNAWSLGSMDMGNEAMPAYVPRFHPTARGSIPLQHWPGRIMLYAGHSPEAVELFFGGLHSVFLDSPEFPKSSFLRNPALNEQEGRVMIGYGLNIVGVGSYNSRGYFLPYREDGSRLSVSGIVPLSLIDGSTILAGTADGSWHLGDFSSISSVAGMKLTDENPSSIRHPWGGKGVYVRVDGSVEVSDRVPELQNWTQSL